jgi:hypothetical protein
MNTDRYEWFKEDVTEEEDLPKMEDELDEAELDQLRQQRILSIL